VLIVANHQSYIDPPLIGVCVRQRHLDYIARAGLFQNWFMRHAVRTLNCIPISEDGNDPRAIREILQRLGEGRAVLIFPEGTRSGDGAMMPFKRGAALLVKRAKCPVVPAAVDGCFDAWPRHHMAPTILGKRVACAFGRPIDSEALISGGTDEAMRMLEHRVSRLRRVVRWKLRRETNGRFPPHGPGDQDPG
jgi:1-acyl-sn-glycerol-3-phosphate acyltransferase